MGIGDVGGLWGSKRPGGNFLGFLKRDAGATSVIKMATLLQDREM